MRVRRAVLSGLLLVSLSAFGRESGPPAELVAVERTAASVRELRERSLPVYHVFEEVLLVRAAPADILSFERHGVNHRVLGDDPERTAYWLLMRRQNPEAWKTIPAEAVAYRTADALVLREIPSSGALPTVVRLRRTRWDPAVLQPVAGPALSASASDSLVASITALVNPDTVRWFIQSLQDFKTRYARASNRDSVAAWIREQFRRIGYPDARLQPFTWSGLGQNNVLAELPGLNPSGEAIVVGGHHDSNSFTTPLLTAPGADDNASGTTAVLEIARVLHAAGFQPELPIRFLTFAAEEVGLVGSEVDAAASRQSGLRIRLMINHDMISHTLEPYTASSADVNYYSGAERYRDLAVQALTDFTVLTPRVGTRNSGGSDSYSYWQEGYPAVYFEETQFSPYYHSPQDLLSNANVEYCAEIIRASCALLLRTSFMPGSIRHLTLSDRGDGMSLALSWHGVSDPDLAGYRVRVSGGGRDTLLFTTDTTVVVGNLQTAVPVIATVTAEDIDGNLGLPAEGTGTPYLAPQAPAAFAATPEWLRVVLEWQRNAEIDLLGYTVYRSAEPGVEGEALTDEPVRDTVLVDSTAAPGVYHYYTVHAIDSARNEGPASPTLRSRGVSLDRGILLVDETADGSTPPGTAPDSAHDAFYRALVTEFASASHDMASEGGIDLAAMGAYSTVLWYGDDISETALASAAKEAIARYLEYGGKFLYTGFRPSRPFRGEDPFATEFMPGDFIYDYLRVGRIEFPLFAPGMNVARGAAPGYGDVRVDAAQSPPVSDAHLRNIEAIYAAEGAIEIYTYDSEKDTTGVLMGKPVGVQSLGSPFRTVVLSFPLAYMVAEDARALVRHILTDVFSEATAIAEAPSALPQDFALAQNYPNPFNPSTTLRFDLPREAAVTLTAYDLLGRELAVLVRGVTAAGRHEVLWDAGGLASGVYFIRLEARSTTGAEVFVATRKVLLLQ